MKKIAIIIDGDLVNRKGQVNASLNRIKYLKKIADYQIDVYSIQSEDDTLTRLLKKTAKRERLPSIQVDDININILWKKNCLLNYLLTYKLKYKPLFYKGWNENYASLFKEYNLISAHSITCGRLALAIHELYRIPYYVTWHGSDIHTLPFITKYNRIQTINVLEKATNNFFVSKALMKASDKLTINTQKQILYNAGGEFFYSYKSEIKEQIKEKLGVSGKKIVAFIGNLFPIKNVLVLPEIFKNISLKYDGEIMFWIIGDGKLRLPLVQLLHKHHVNCKLWGNQPVEKMPTFMNVIDVLILPSKNEGLPLVTVEALSCGSNVVGSNVGGIAEVIGDDNVFDLNNDFIDNISSRVIEMLNGSIKQPLSDVFSWDSTAHIENEIYQKDLSK